MNRYQIWDTASSTLLYESEILKDTADELQGVIKDGGSDVLDDISLSIKDSDDGRVWHYVGEDVLLALQERLSREAVEHR